MLATVRAQRGGLLPKNGGCLGWMVWLAWSLNLVSAERPVPLEGAFLRDYAETRGFRLGRPTGFQWTPDGREVVFLRSEARSGRQKLYAMDAETGVVRDLAHGGPGTESGESVSAEEQARRERMRVTAGGFTSFEMTKDGTRILAPLGDRLFWIERSTGLATELAIRGASFDSKLSPDGRNVGFVRNHDVWVYDLARGRERQITRDGSEMLSHGEAEFVAAEEMARFTGWWWAPDGKSILFQETDAREVEVWQVADPAYPEKTPRAQFYPRPGKANVQVRLGIRSLRGGRTVWVRWDVARYPYFTKADWHAAMGLTLVVQSRDQRELALLRVDPGTGRTQVLLEERDPAWVNLDEAMPRGLQDGRGFLWTSEREGAWQLELRNAEGVLDKVLVRPDQGYRGLVHLDNANRQVVVAVGRDPSEIQLARVDLTRGDGTVLTEEPGLHGGVFSVDGTTWVHTVATPGEMPRSWIQRGVGDRRFEVPQVAADPGVRVQAEMAWVEVEVEGGGRQRFQTEVIRPRNFDARRRYPVLVDVYGGPHVNVVQASMGSRLLGQWLADQGFVVVSMDNRGTPRRGRAWERAIAGRFADVPLADQVACLRELGRRFRELDLERVGIVGWSFGGYLSALAVLRRPDVFRAAVAGAPVTDWMDYDTHYTERYLGVPGPGDTVYAGQSLIEDASRLERPLLLIHGTGDDNVFFRHSLKLANALFRAGKPFEILPLPGLTHMVPDPVVAERQWARTIGFFREHLGVPTEPGGAGSQAR